MALPRPNNDPNQPIPNQPFYAPLNPYVNGPYFPVDLGAGIDMTSSATVPSLVNDVAGVLIAGDGISISTIGTDSTVTNIGVTGLVAGPNITLSASSGVVTISAAGGPSGSVTSVGTGVGLTGGPITTSGTISLATSGVAAGSYTNPNITVDAYGRITVATSGTASLTGLTGTVPVVVTGSAPTLNIAVNAASTVAPGVVQLNDATSSTSTTQAATANAVKTAYDAALASVQSVTGTAPIVSSGGTNPAISLANTAVTPGTYNYATITVDAQGRLTAASSGGAPSGGTVTSVTAGTGLSGGTITSTGTIALANTAVTAGSYTNGSFTVDAQGRLTAASSGTAPVTSVTGTAPVSVTAGATPVVSIAAASTTAAGAVQLNNTTTSTSTTLALTAAQGKNLQDQINALAVTSNITLAGTIDGSTGNLVTVTTEGTAAGFTVGSPLPAAAAGNAEYFVIVTVAGTMTPPGGISTVTHVGDWFLSSGTAWQFLDVGPAIPAASTTTAGIVELATTAETQTGTDTTRAVTPAGAAATYIACSAYTAKGAILGASAASTPVALPVGANGQILYACSIATSGLCWAAAPSASAATPLVRGTLFGCSGGNNTSVGENALKSLVGGASNTAVGIDALCSVVTGTSNTAMGDSALASVTGTQNTGVGGAALFQNASGTCNTAFGHHSMVFSSGSCNTGLGLCSLRVVSGSSNVAVGANAGSLLSSGGSNVLIGPGVQAASATGSCQLAIGFSASDNWLTGTSTKAIKPGAGIIDCASSCGTAGQVLMSNGSNAICWGALPASGIPCACVTGKGALVTGTAASTPSALAVGTDGQILYACSTATNGLCWAAAPSGASPATPTTSGVVLALTDGAGSPTANTALGYDALNTTTTGQGNVALGVRAGIAITTGSGNIYAGVETGLATLDGNMNVGVGTSALSALTSGINNVALGAFSGNLLTTESCNVIVGGYGGSVGQNNSIALSDGAGNLRLHINQFAGWSVDGTDANVGTQGQVLTSNGPFGNPNWTTLPALQACGPITSQLGPGGANSITSAYGPGLNSLNYNSSIQALYVFAVDTVTNAVYTYNWVGNWLANNNITYTMAQLQQSVLDTTGGRFTVTLGFDTGYQNKPKFTIQYVSGNLLNITHGISWFNLYGDYA